MPRPHVLRFAPLLLLAACAAPGHGAPAGAPYDPKIDESATALQLDADSFLTEIATTPDGTYARFTGWYSEYELKLRALLVRVDAHAANEASHRQIEQIRADVEQLREAHKPAPLSLEAAEKFRQMFNDGWRDVLATELAKPRG